MQLRLYMPHLRSAAGEQDPRGERRAAVPTLRIAWRRWWLLRSPAGRGRHLLRRRRRLDLDRGRAAVREWTAQARPQRGRIIPPEPARLRDRPDGRRAPVRSAAEKLAAAGQSDRRVLISALVIRWAPRPARFQKDRARWDL